MRHRAADIPLHAGLFSSLSEEPHVGDIAQAPARVRRPNTSWDQDLFLPLIDVLNRVSDTNSAHEIFRLLVGQSEAAVGHQMMNGAADAWRDARLRRNLTASEVGELPALPDAYKLLFNFYFRDDLYGKWIHNSPIVLSSGSFDEEVFGLSGALKACINFALLNNWYGYSDSRGREQTREAIADLECRVTPGGQICSSAEIAVTLGATAAISSLAGFIARGRPRKSIHAICGVPNYVPLVAAVSRVFSTGLVPTPLKAGTVDIGRIIDRARHGADLVLLQTVNNPWGIGVSPEQLRQLIDSAAPECTILLDMCHEHFATPGIEAPSRAVQLIGKRGATAVFIRSLSKQWAIPGLKCGWIRAPRSFIDAFYDHASTTYGGPPSIFALLLEVYARFEALRLDGFGDAAEIERYFASEYSLDLSRLRRGFDHYVCDREDFIARVRLNRQICMERLSGTPIEVIPADYSINLLCRHGSLPDYATYRELIEKHNVSVFPGTLCMLPGPGTFRISPNLSNAALDEGLTRLTAWAMQGG